VHLGCGTGSTCVAVAAAHPDAEVWAWGHDLADVEATRRLGDAASVVNLTVHERPGLPPDLGGGLTDFAVVQDVLEASSDEQRECIFGALGMNVRPGGLVCVAYPTTVGWSEIAPVRALMRQVARGYSGDPARLVPHVLGLLGALRAGNAKFLATRPAVVAWLDDLSAMDHATIARMLRDEFRPLSHAQVAEAMESIGCVFVGSAQLTDELNLGVPPALTTMVAAVPTPVLRETYRDLATRRAQRLDVFRRGAAPMTVGDRKSALEMLRLAAQSRGDDDLLAYLDPDLLGRLRSGPLTVAELDRDIDQAEMTARILLAGGWAQPVVPGAAPADGAMSSHFRIAGS
jgi:hypothetical protein